MKFLDLVKSRRSTRKYLPDSIEQEKLDYIMKCVRLAPSVANLQPWKFFIIKNDGIKQAVFESYPRKWMLDAPIYIVACGNTDLSWKRNYDGKDHVDTDVSIAFEHLCLAAEEQGLGTCWIANFSPDILKKNLNLPEKLIPIAITPLGYPHPETGERTSRKNIDEIFNIL